MGQDDNIVFKPVYEPEYLIHGHGGFSMVIMPDRLIGMNEHRNIPFPADSPDSVEILHHPGDI